MYGVNMKKLYMVLAWGALATTAAIFFTTNNPRHALVPSSSGHVRNSHRQSGARHIPQMTGEGNHGDEQLGSSWDRDQNSSRTQVTRSSPTNLDIHRQKVQSANSIKLEVLSRNGSDSVRNGDLMKIHSAPRKNLLFLKTHKTGSSTIQNIVYRYGDKNGLTFALPVVNVYMGTPLLFQEKYAIESPSGKYNMLANHARYNRPTMQNIMYSDAAYITIIRHPSTQFESFYDFYGFSKTFGVDLATFIKEPMRFYLRQGAHPMHNALNPTLYDLGMSKATLTDEKAILEKINNIEAEFDLVMVSEYFLESLVLLKDLMCWELEDVTYFSANARSKSSKSGSQVLKKTFEQIAKWNRGDTLLYGHFNRTLWAKVDAYGRKRMARDVRTLQKMNAVLAEKCLGGTMQVKNVESVVNQYVLKKSAENDEQCVRMIRPELQYLGVLKKKQAEKWRHH